MPYHSEWKSWNSGFCSRPSRKGELSDYRDVAGRGLTKACTGRGHTSLPPQERGGSLSSSPIPAGEGHALLETEMKDRVPPADPQLQCTLWEGWLQRVFKVASVQLFATPWTAASRLLCPWGFSRQEYWNGLPSPPPEDLTNPGIELRSPALQLDSLLTEPPGNPKIIEVHSLSLLQGIFPTEESNEGLLNCRLILYQLNYQGSAI